MINKHHHHTFDQIINLLFLLIYFTLIKGVFCYINAHCEFIYEAGEQYCNKCRENRINFPKCDPYYGYGLNSKTYDINKCENKCFENCASNERNCSTCLFGYSGTECKSCEFTQSSNNEFCYEPSESFYSVEIIDDKLILKFFNEYLNYDSLVQYTKCEFITNYYSLTNNCQTNSDPSKKIIEIIPDLLQNTPVMPQIQASFLFYKDGQGNNQQITKLTPIQNQIINNQRIYYTPFRVDEILEDSQRFIGLTFDPSGQTYSENPQNQFKDWIAKPVQIQFIDYKNLFIKSIIKNEKELHLQNIQTKVDQNKQTYGILTFSNLFTANNVYMVKLSAGNKINDSIEEYDIFFVIKPKLPVELWVKFDYGILLRKAQFQNHTLNITLQSDVYNQIEKYYYTIDNKKTEIQTNNFILKPTSSSIYELFLQQDATFQITANSKNIEKKYILQFFKTTQVIRLNKVEFILNPQFPSKDVYDMYIDVDDYIDQKNAFVLKKITILNQKTKEEQIFTITGKFIPSLNFASGNYDLVISLNDQYLNVHTLQKTFYITPILSTLEELNPNCLNSVSIKDIAQIDICVTKYKDILKDISSIEQQLGQGVTGQKARVMVQQIMQFFVKICEIDSEKYGKQLCLPLFNLQKLFTGDNTYNRYEYILLVIQFIEKEYSFLYNIGVDTGSFFNTFFESLYVSNILINDYRHEVFLLFTQFFSNEKSARKYCFIISNKFNIYLRQEFNEQYDEINYALEKMFSDYLSSLSLNLIFKCSFVEDTFFMQGFLVACENFAAAKKHQAKNLDGTLKMDSLILKLINFLFMFTTNIWKLRMQKEFLLRYQQSINQIILQSDPYKAQKYSLISKQSAFLNQEYMVLFMVNSILDFELEPNISKFDLVLIKDVYISIEKLNREMLIVYLEDQKTSQDPEIIKSRLIMMKRLILIRKYTLDLSTTLNQYLDVENTLKFDIKGIVKIQDEVEYYLNVEFFFSQIDSDSINPSNKNLYIEQFAILIRIQYLVIDELIRLDSDDNYIIQKKKTIFQRLDSLLQQEIIYSTRDTLYSQMIYMLDKDHSVVELFSNLLCDSLIINSQLIQSIFSSFPTSPPSKKLLLSVSVLEYQSNIVNFILGILEQYFDPSDIAVDIKKKIVTSFINVSSIEYIKTNRTLWHNTVKIIKRAADKKVMESLYVEVEKLLQTYIPSISTNIINFNDPQLELEIYQTLLDIQKNLNQFILPQTVYVDGQYKVLESSLKLMISETYIKGIDTKYEELSLIVKDMVQNGKLISTKQAQILQNYLKNQTTATVNLLSTQTTSEQQKKNQLKLYEIMIDTEKLYIEKIKEVGRSDPYFEEITKNFVDILIDISKFEGDIKQFKVKFYVIIKELILNLNTKLLTEYQKILDNFVFNQSTEIYKDYLETMPSNSNERELGLIKNQLLFDIYEAVFEEQIKFRKTIDKYDLLPQVNKITSIMMNSTVQILEINQPSIDYKTSLFTLSSHKVDEENLKKLYLDNNKNGDTINTDKNSFYNIRTISWFQNPYQYETSYKELYNIEDKTKELQKDKEILKDKIYQLVSPEISKKQVSQNNPAKIYDSLDQTLPYPIKIQFKELKEDNPVQCIQRTTESKWDLTSCKTNVQTNQSDSIKKYSCTCKQASPTTFISDLKDFLINKNVENIFSSEGIQGVLNLENAHEYAAVWTIGVANITLIATIILGINLDKGVNILCLVGKTLSDIKVLPLGVGQTSVAAIQKNQEQQDNQHGKQTQEHENKLKKQIGKLEIIKNEHRLEETKYSSNSGSPTFFLNSQESQKAAINGLQQINLQDKRPRKSFKKNKSNQIIDISDYPEIKDIVKRDSFASSPSHELNKDRKSIYSSEQNSIIGNQFTNKQLIYNVASDQSPQLNDQEQKIEKQKEILNQQKYIQSQFIKYLRDLRKNQKVKEILLLHSLFQIFLIYEKNMSRAVRFTVFYFQQIWILTVNAIYGQDLNLIGIITISIVSTISNSIAKTIITMTFEHRIFKFIGIPIYGGMLSFCYYAILVAISSQTPTESNKCIQTFFITFAFNQLLFEILLSLFKIRLTYLLVNKLLPSSFIFKVLGVESILNLFK